RPPGGPERSAAACLLRRERPAARMLGAIRLGRTHQVRVLGGEATLVRGGVLGPAVDVVPTGPVRTITLVRPITRGPAQLRHVPPPSAPNRASGHRQSRSSRSAAPSRSDQPPPPAPIRQPAAGSSRDG